MADVTTPTSMSVTSPAFSVSFETLTVRREGRVLFVEIAAPPMNLLGPELVRDLVSLIQGAEADDAVRVQERRPRLLHLSRRSDPSQRGPGGGAAQHLTRLMGRG
jgi:hypothetical protein